MIHLGTHLGTHPGLGLGTGSGLGLVMGESVYDPDTGSWVDMSGAVLSTSGYAVASRAQAGGSVEVPRVQAVGPTLPPGFVRAPFNCPEGSDFAKSQEVGMCVGPAYDPIYSQAAPNGLRTYYNLDGSVAGTDTPPRGGLIPGVPNTYLYLGLGALALFVLMGRRR